MTQSAMFSLLALSTPVVGVIVGVVCALVAVPAGMFFKARVQKKYGSMQVVIPIPAINRLEYTGLWDANTNNSEGLHEKNATIPMMIKQ